MSKQAQSQEILGHTYTVTPLGTKTGITVMCRIKKLLGGAASSDVPLAGALEALSEADVLFLCDTFAKLTSVKMPDGAEPLLAHVFDDHFSADYGSLLLWLAFCLEVNFPNLFLAFAELQKKFAGPSGASSKPV